MAQLLMVKYYELIIISNYIMAQLLMVKHYELIIISNYIMAQLLFQIIFWF